MLAEEREKEDQYAAESIGGEHLRDITNVLGNNMDKGQGGLTNPKICMFLVC